jgi:hypothetical protein
MRAFQETNHIAAQTAWKTEYPKTNVGSYHMAEPNQHTQTLKQWTSGYQNTQKLVHDALAKTASDSPKKIDSLGKPTTDDLTNGGIHDKAKIPSNLDSKEINTKQSPAIATKPVPAQIHSAEPKISIPL